jgi:sterol desaturase/sphingolipid hydroxylase (fatty acid hydroxylase superfamily)
MVDNSVRAKLYPLAQWLIFPVVLATTLGGAVLLFPWLGAAPAVLVMQVVGGTSVLLAERVMAHLSDWNRNHGDLRTDVLHAVVSGMVTTRLASQAARAAGGLLAAWLSSVHGAGLWPAHWPFLLQLALALLIAELPQYWVHRWQHEWELLWRFHSVHHSAPRLYWLNASRFHPLDIGLLYLVGYVPLIALGCPREVILLFALFDSILGMLQHSNLDVRLGPLNRIFSMAEPHRWHHSRILNEANTNYGSNLIVWDLLFGTFFLPSDRQAPQDVGIADLPGFPAGYLAQLKAPFRWAKIKAQRG